MRPITRIVLLAVLATTSSCTHSSPTLPPPVSAPVVLEVVERITAEDGVVVGKFSNGLTVIVKRTQTAPVVCVKAYVRAGGLYEHEWLGCGISHLAEHLVAQGAEHQMGSATADEAKQSSDRVKEIGAQTNAYTSMDHTCYYASATGGKGMDCIDLIAGWLSNPKITREDFEREHGVVQRELEMGMDEPSREMWYAHSANAFANHPAAVPVIGLRKPLAALQYEDVLEYVKRMYIPQNIIFVVVGDIDVEDAMERTCRAFADLLPGRIPDLSLPPVAPLSGIRRVTRPHKTIKETIERLSFQTIPLVHEDLYALDVLSYVLTTGRASRLVQKIEREKKLVTSISSSSWTPAWGKGLFTISFRTRPEKADPAETAILDELKLIVTEGVTSDELDRAKRQKIADFVYPQQTVQSQAEMLGSDYLSTGDAEFSRRYTERIQQVTSQQVRDVARRYFTFDRMAITRLVPEKQVGATEQVTTRKTESEEVFFTLPNGLRVILHPTSQSPSGSVGGPTGIVAMTFATVGGLLQENNDTNGLGALMGSLSTRGAGDRSAKQIAAFFDRAGGSLTGSCGNNTFYWKTTVLNDSFDEAMDILSDVIQRPTFSEDELEKLRPVHLSAIDAADENWRSQRDKFFRKKFFPDSPYRLLRVGNRQVVESATSQQIAAHYRRCMKAGSSVLSIFGDFDAVAGKKQIERLFAELPPGQVDVKPIAPRRVDATGELHLLKTSNEIAGITIGAPGMKIQNLEDRVAIDVLDTIISGYWLPSGWLHEELRGKQLVYVVHAYNQVGLLPGAFVTYAGTQPGKAPEVVKIILRNLRRAAGYTPTQKEIDLAVNEILTVKLLNNQSMADLSMQAGLDELYGFGYDLRKRIEKLYRAVTPGRVTSVGKKYLSGGFVVTVTTPQAEAFEKDDTERQRNTNDE